MPPYSSMRKGSAATPSATEILPVNNLSNGTAFQPRRTTSGRAIRLNTTRPANYYARPFGVPDSASYNDPTAMIDAGPPGFFPGLQYFSDVMVALPKEIMRQFTLLKEVEAKICGPSEKLDDLIDGLLAQPVPSRAQIVAASSLTAASSAANAVQQGMLSFTANNSANVSAAPSLVNGAAGRHSAHASVTGSVNGEDGMSAVTMTEESPEEKRRRTRFHELRVLAHGLLPNMDEKNIVLAESGRVLAQQESRIDSVWPQVENEIHEEARFGSMTHWAYSDNRQKKVSGASVAANRRDIAAANNLAAAATVVREGEIAQARRDAVREAAKDRGKSKRVADATVDSDFDDKPRRAPKSLKGKAAANAAQQAITGLGITNAGEPAAKRKKVGDKAGMPSSSQMERSASATGKASKVKEIPRSAAAAGDANSKKFVKPKSVTALPKRKLNSTQPSPMLASSPLVPNFAQPTVESAAARPQSARLRANSSATNNRNDKVQEQENKPAPTVLKTSSERVGTKRKTAQDEDDEESEEATKARLEEAANQLHAETRAAADSEMPDIEPKSNVSRSTSSKNSGRVSKAGTPRQESFPSSATVTTTAEARIRSTRSKPRSDSISSETPAGSNGHRKHQRAVSNSHLMKQIAPFNRSPDLDRHRPSPDDDGMDTESLDGESAADNRRGANSSRETRRASTRRPLSRRNTANMSSAQNSPALPPVSRDSTPDASAASPPASSTNTRARGQSFAEKTNLMAEDDDNDALSAVVSDEGNEPRPVSRGIPALDAVPALEEDNDDEEDEPDRPELDSNEAEDTGDGESEVAVTRRATASTRAQESRTPAAAMVTRHAAAAAHTADDDSDAVLPNGVADVDDDDEIPDEDEEDPDDPNEDRYCYCNRGSYGDMVACDNPNCPMEWFHLGCTELREPPSADQVWFCAECRPKHGGASGGAVGSRKARSGKRR